jgi:hypothetical protein
MLQYPGIERECRLLLATTIAAWLYQKLGFEPWPIRCCSGRSTG